MKNTNTNANINRNIQNLPLWANERDDLSSIEKKEYFDSGVPNLLADSQEEMTFSEFAKTLFPYCSNGIKQAEFVVLLVDKIMAGRPGRAYKDGNYRNPVREKDERTQLSYFNGERNISRRDACIILGRVDKYKFETYLRNVCSDRALELLKEDVSCKVPMLGKKDIVEVCADQFESIIKILALK